MTMHYTDDPADDAGDDKLHRILDDEAAERGFSDLRFVTAGLRAHQASECFHSAYWAESQHRLDLHRKNAIEALRQAADAVGFDLTPKVPA